MKSFILIVALLSALSLQAQTESPTQPAGSVSPVNQNPPPLDPKNMDTSVKPQDDFYLYANGGWLKRNPVPPEYSRWGSFRELEEKNNEALHKIAEKTANAHVDANAAPEVQKVGDYYASGMDEKTIEGAQTKPLEDELKRIDAIKDRADLLSAIARLHTIAVDAFFEFGSGQDAKDSTREIAQAHQGGLGLPDRDYYTKTDEDSKKKRAAYVDHVTKMLTLLGEAPGKAASDAKKIMALETSLAKASRTRVELRDPQKNYNKMSQADLQKLTPDWNWADYFKATNLTEPGDINVGQPEFFKAANAMFTKTSIDDWKTYLRWHLIDDAAAELSKDFLNEDFNFNQAVLRGTKKIKRRWKRVLASTNGPLAEALAKLYVAVYFRPKADDPVNYGGMGAVIGHEMTHGFDDQGRQFDEVGNLRDWWSKQSAEEYDRRRKAVVDQYSEYQPLPGKHINGELTQGENIADIGGIKLAYAALQKALDKNPQAREQKIDGFTPEQRFFLGWAQVWRANQREDDLQLRLNTDPHSPTHYRCNGPISNLPEFARAFNLPDNCPMMRPADKRVNIW